MPTGRRELTAAVVDGKCYVFGGSIGVRSEPLSDVEIYDPETDQWSRGTDMPTARFFPVAVAIDGKIYVAGGAAGTDAIYGNLEVYDPVSDSWNTLTPMPTPRAAAAAAALDDKLYVFGGTNDPFGQRFATAEVYDPATDQWSRIADMPRSLATMSAEVAENRILIIGGSDGSQAGVSDVNAYDPALDRWTAMAPLPATRSIHASALVNGELFVIGGALSNVPPHVALSSVLSRVLPVTQTTLPINFGLSDAWYNPSTIGQGFLITVFPDIQEMFLAWFTYDTERPAEDVPAILGEPGHRWLTAQGPYHGDTANLTIYETEGGEFDAVDPPASTDPAGDGSLTIEFADCNSALATYQITSLGISGEIPLERIALDNVPLCEALARP
jgi:N-acetylneuraminic acid mutarotase